MFEVGKLSDESLDSLLVELGKVERQVRLMKEDDSLLGFRLEKRVFRLIFSRKKKCVWGFIRLDSMGFNSTDDAFMRTDQQSNKQS